MGICEGCCCSPGKKQLWVGIKDITEHILNLSSWILDDLEK